MSQAPQKFVVIGTGPAGHQAAIELARLAPGASIKLIGGEPSLPYDRPALSKAVLLGRSAPDDLTLGGASSYEASGIAHAYATIVTAIDRDQGKIYTSEGEAFSYDRLLLATGSRPRELPEHVRGDASVHYLRTIADAQRLEARLIEGKHIVVIGGGFIGLEVAAAARARKCQVTVLEAADRLLSRGMPELLSRWALDYHQAQGISVLLGSAVTACRKEGARTAVRCGEREILADTVVVGIGIVPNVELAEAAGLRVANGIVVDEHCATSDPYIYAAGEVTSHPNRLSGGNCRIESWKTALEQAKVAAHNMAGQEATFDLTPWLWSDQYDCNIQSLGFPDLAMEYMLRGEVEDNRWTLIGLDGRGQLIGAVAVNNGRDISMLRSAMAKKQPLPANLLQGATVVKAA